MTPYVFLKYAAIVVVGVWASAYILIAIFWALSYQESKRWILRQFRDKSRGMEDMDHASLLKYLWKLTFFSTATDEGQLKIGNYWVSFNRVTLEKTRIYEITARDETGYVAYRAIAWTFGWNSHLQNFATTDMKPHDPRYREFRAGLEEYVHATRKKLESSWF